MLSNLGYVLQPVTQLLVELVDTGITNSLINDSNSARKPITRAIRSVK